MSKVEVVWKAPKQEYIVQVATHKVHDPRKLVWRDYHYDADFDEAKRQALSIVDTYSDVRIIKRAD